MWAQLLKVRVREGKEGELPRLFAELEKTEQPGSGLIRVTAMRDQNDPLQLYIVPVFESEGQARARERDPRREEGLKVVGSLMADIFDGPPEFVDLEVLAVSPPGA